MSNLAYLPIVKQCTTCKVSLPLTSFTKNKANSIKRNASLEELVLLVNYLNQGE